jgi:hypothetical protein
MALLHFIERASVQPDLNIVTLLKVSVAFFLVYLGTLTIYRLFFSPIAKFPGSKLTAICGWYETYYQLIKNGGGQFTFKIAEWHEKYGQLRLRDMSS